MRKHGFSIIVLVLLAASLAAAPAHAADSCYQQSSLVFFQQVVELVSSGRDTQLDCWVLRLRLRGAGTPQGNAMICKGNACSPQLPQREGIYWADSSPWNQNILRVTRMENLSCTDVTFCVQPIDPAETILVDFYALFEEGYFLGSPTYRPRWSHGLADLSALEGNKSHCLDNDPPPQRVEGSICL